jgi:5-methylcytosine-specific restriction endonuclease McrA
MFEQVREAIEVLRQVVRDFDPERLDGSLAQAYLEAFAEGERLCGAGKALAVRRFEECGSWRRDGHRSAAHWLAESTGVSVGSALETVRTAREMRGLPETAAAFRAGALSESQAREITAAAGLDPAAETQLLHMSRASSFKGLRDRCREIAMAAVDDEAAARRLHESRHVHAWTERDGAYRADVRLAPDAGAKFDAALRATVTEIMAEARETGRREPQAAYLADALVALVTNGPSKPVEVRLEVDYEAVLRGHVEGDEHCRLSGIGPIPVTIARSLLNDARVTVLTREGTRITAISSPTRTIPAKLRRLLEARDPVCAVHGCHNARALQIDHIVPVEQHGPSTPENTWRICPHHHRLKTLYGWRVEGPPEMRRLVPPDDPDPP